MAQTALFAIFGFSLAGIAGLFALKLWEDARGRIVAARVRRRADRLALALRAMGLRGVYVLENLPAFVGRLMRLLVHLGAVAVARIARAAERRAHQVADFVSHKHRFERGERKSDYLHRVAPKRRRIRVTSEAEIEQAS